MYVAGEKRAAAIAALMMLACAMGCSESDNTPPAPPIVDDVQASSCDQDPFVSGTAEFGATVIIRGGTSEVTTIADPYTARWRVAVPVGSSRMLTVVAVDAAGNESEPTSVAFGDAELGGVPAMIDLSTTPSPAAVTAGEDVAYTVEVIDGCGNPLSDAVFEVETNAPGAIAAAGTLSGLTKAGNFTIVARIPGSNIVDTESLTVGADASTAVVDLQLQRNLSSVGLPVGYAVTIVDGFGNPISATPTIDVPTDAGDNIDTDTRTITFSSAGTHTVTASLGAASDSELIVINIADVLAPTNVSITSPDPGTIYRRGDTVTVTVHAEDDLGLTQIVFQASGETNSFQQRLLPSGTLNTDQVFDFDIRDASIYGTIDLIAQAIDGAGLITTSAIVTINVDPAASIDAGGVIVSTVSIGGQLDRPRGIAVDGDNIYVTNSGGGPLVLLIDAQGDPGANQTSIVPNQPNIDGEDVLFYDGGGTDYVFVSTNNGGGSDRIYRLDVTNPAAPAVVSNWSADVSSVPRGLAVDGPNSIACLYSDERVRRFDPDASGPNVAVSSSMVADVVLGNSWGLEVVQQGCDALEFECGNGTCIANNLVCDDADDCGDNSDEAACGDCGAGSGDFECANLSCVARANICDGGDDCGDGSDEANCRRYAGTSPGGDRHEVETWYDNGNNQDVDLIAATVELGWDLNNPHGIAVSPSGKFAYVASQDANAIYRLPLGLGAECDDTCFVVAEGFDEAWGLVFDAAGDLLVTDRQDDIVYRLQGLVATEP